jgi:site-specific DNA recombinase
LNLLQKLDNLYENADLKAKKAIVSSTFPEKLYFVGKKCRTPRINEVLLRALNADKGFRKTKSGLTPKNLVLSAFVEQDETKSNFLLEDIELLIELKGAIAVS